MSHLDVHGEVQKSHLAFRTISEVSQEINVPQHVLRFWESRFSQIKPLKSGGGRRYYRPEDIELLRCIKDYLYKQGYTIKGVQRLLKEHRMAHIAAAMEANQRRRQEERHAADSEAQAGEAFSTGPDRAQDIPPDEFTETAMETTRKREEEALPSEDSIAKTLRVVTRIHDELHIPVEPMQLTAAALVQQALEQKQFEFVDEESVPGADAPAARETAPPRAAVQDNLVSDEVRSELKSILSELTDLRDMLKGAA